MCLNLKSKVNTYTKGRYNIYKKQDEVLKCPVFSTTQRYSVYCHSGGKKPEIIHIFKQTLRILITQNGSIVKIIY